MALLQLWLGRPNVYCITLTLTITLALTITLTLPITLTLTITPTLTITLTLTITVTENYATLTPEATSPIQYLLQLCHWRPKVYGIISTVTMNLILTRLQHNVDLYMDHNSDTGTNIIGSISNSDKVVFRWQEIEMYCIINGHKLSIPCSCKADTLDTNLHSNIQCKERHTEPDLAAVSATLLEHPPAAVVTLIKIPVVGPRAAAAATIIKSWVPVAMELTQIKIANNGTNPGAIIAVTRARQSSWWLIEMTMTMNCDPQVEEPAYYITVVILPVWTTYEG